jgi:hypothetical protein
MPVSEKTSRALPRAAALATTILLALAVGGCSRGEAFPVADYLKAPANLSGNRYILEAEVDSQIRSKDGVGRIVVVKPLKDKGRLALVIPDSLDANLSPTQHYRFSVSVRPDALYVSKLDKI